MKAHVIANEIIINTIEVKSLDFMPNLIDASIGGSIGWGYSNGVLIPPFPKSIDIDKANKIQMIKDTTNLSVPVTVGTVTYNGGESSASAINGAIQLAQLNLETTLQIWDINNSIATYSLAQAEAIVKAVALDYRTNALARQTRIMAVNAIVIDPLGTYPDYASAKAALDLI